MNKWSLVSSTKRQEVDLTMNQTRMSQSYFPARNSPQALNSNQVVQLIDGLKALHLTALHICQTRQISSCATQPSVSTQHALRNTCEAANFSFLASDQNNKTRSSNTIERKQSSSENDIFDATFNGQSKFALDHATTHSQIQLENSTVVIVDVISKI